MVHLVTASTRELHRLGNYTRFALGEANHSAERVVLAEADGAPAHKRLPTYPTIAHLREGSRDVATIPHRLGPTISSDREFRRISPFFTTCACGNQRCRTSVPDSQVRCAGAAELSQRRVTFL